MTTSKNANLPRREAVFHHLLVGGCGSVGVAFAKYLDDSNQKNKTNNGNAKNVISLYVREHHTQRLAKDSHLYYHDVNGYMLKHFGFAALSILTAIAPAMACGKLSPFLPFVVAFAVFCTAMRVTPLFVAKAYSQIFPIKLKRIAVASFANCPEDIAAKSSSFPAPISHIWLCLSSTQLRAMAEEISNIAEEAAKAFKPITTNAGHAGDVTLTKLVIVNLTPGMTDPSFLMEHIPALKQGRVTLVQGTIPAIAYQHPLATERYTLTDRHRRVASSIVLFTSPDPIQLFSDDEAARTITARATLSAMTTESAKSLTTDPTVHSERVLPEAVFTALVLGIESNHWSFLSTLNIKNTIAIVGSFFELAEALLKTCADDDSLVTAQKQLTINEARGIVTNHGKRGRNPSTSKSRAWLKTIAGTALVYPVFAILAVTQYILLPFDLERYFEYHFTKVGAQMSGFCSLGLKVAQRENLSARHTATLYIKTITARNAQRTAIGGGENK